MLHTNPLSSIFIGLSGECIGLGWPLVTILEVAPAAEAGIFIFTIDA
jgi:hypothetical protein